MIGYSLLNWVLGPVMWGPSSSHAAAPHAIARTARELSTSMGEVIVEARVVFDPGGSFARVYRGQGSDEAFAAGLCGVDVDSTGYGDALRTLTRTGDPFPFKVEIAPLSDCDHPNRVDLHLTCRTSFGDTRQDTYQALSTGGGTFEIRSLNRHPVRRTGDTGALILEGADLPVEKVRTILEGYGDILVSPLEPRVGALRLRAPERESLGEGTLALTVYTTEDPNGSRPAPLRLPSGS